MKLNTKGFGLVPVLLILLATTAVAGAGYYVYTSRENEASPQVIHQVDPDPVDPGTCCGGIAPEKPIIYLYPEKTQDVTVRLDYNGRLLFTYPDYEEAVRGWRVTASPDGRLINKADGREYSYLFWEGKDQNQYDLTTGFVVEGSDTKAFLQKVLSEIGLTPKEYNEMIVYWLPRLQNNKYNLIHFAGKQYTDNAELTVTPTPDSLLRVFMVFKPLEEPMEIEPQEFPVFTRRGFTVIEWGGAEVR